MQTAVTACYPRRRRRRRRRASRFAGGFVRSLVGIERASEVGVPARPESVLFQKRRKKKKKKSRRGRRRKTASLQLEAGASALLWGLLYKMLRIET